MAVRRLSDEELMDYTYNKLFGDLDKIDAESTFKNPKEGLGAPQEVTENAGKAGMDGIEISIKPLMASAEEGEKAPQDGIEDDDDDEDDKLRGISGMSPLMAQLHGKR